MVYVSSIYYAFKEEVVKFDFYYRNYILKQYLHIITITNAGRYAKKILTQKKNVLNKTGMNTNQYQKPIENLVSCSTNSLAEE